MSDTDDGRGPRAPQSGAGSLLETSPEALPEELVEVLARGRDVRIERIVSRGHASPPGFWYEQERSEWVAVLAGSARLRLEGPAQVVTLERGDWMSIEAGRRHRVEWTAPGLDTVWLAVFYRREGE